MVCDPNPASDGRRPRPPRFQHRAHRHTQAHAESALMDPPPICDNPLVCNDEPRLVARQQDLVELIVDLRKAGSFAFDSEFIGELTYIPKLCLIQAASTTCIALIDSLAELDLTPFWELVADPSIEKIVHAGQQDVEPLFRAIGRPPAGLFDTQISTGFIGLGHPLSLSKLIYTLVGAKLSKGLTFTHWDRRPLSAQQLRYAANDVRYLPVARQAIGRRLEELGHTAWAMEESASLADPALYQFDPQTQYLKIRGSSGLSPRNLAVLRELTAWRDQAAQQENLPPRSLLRDEILLDLARTPIESTAALNRVRGLPRPVESAYGPQIVAATARGLVLPPEQCPPSRNHDPAPDEKFRADALYIAAQCLCAGRQIDPSLLTSRQEIGELYRLVCAGESTGGLRIMQGWRRVAVGQMLLDMMAGRASFAADWANGSLHATATPI
jgi:ribonuclease D